MGGFCGRVCPVFVEANVALVNVEKLRGDGGVRSAHVVHVVLREADKKAETKVIDANKSVLVRTQLATHKWEL